MRLGSTTRDLDFPCTLHVQGNDVQAGLRYPNFQQKSTFSSSAATWLQLWPSLYKKINAIFYHKMYTNLNVTKVIW
jgi:hypothetical protein